MRIRFFYDMQLHPSLILFLLISMLTATFIHLFIIFSIVFIHELGHLLAAKHYKWRIRKMVLWVFGGVLETEEYSTRPIKEEVIVTIAGPLQHGLIYGIALILQSLDLLPASLIQLIMQYNLMILLFNLLPIYPLDGGRLHFYLLSYLLPYRTAYRYVIAFSIVTIICLIGLQILILPFTFTAMILLLFLLVELIKYWKNESFTFIRFLLFRHHIRQDQYRTKILFSQQGETLSELFNRFYRNRYHHIHLSTSASATESTCLYYYFHPHLQLRTIGEVMKKDK